jgi:hypothetical protein
MKPDKTRISIYKDVTSGNHTKGVQAAVDGTVESAIGWFKLTISLHYTIRKHTSLLL